MNGEKIMKKIRETFNDGVLTIVSKKPIRDEERSVIGFDEVDQYHLHFHFMSLRDEDFNLAKTINKRMSRKVKVLMHPRLKSIVKDNVFARLDNTTYDVFHADFTKDHAYLYMEATHESTD